MYVPAEQSDYECFDPEATGEALDGRVARWQSPQPGFETFLPGYLPGDPMDTRAKLSATLLWKLLPAGSSDPSTGFHALSGNVATRFVQTWAAIAGHLDKAGWDVRIGPNRILITRMATCTKITRDLIAAGADNLVYETESNDGDAWHGVMFEHNGSTFHWPLLLTSHTVVRHATLWRGRLWLDRPPRDLWFGVFDPEIATQVGAVVGSLP